MYKRQTDTFLASDSLGWTYQFWQAQRKDAVNASGKKIGAAELSAVTQLFTEDYMVDFLLDNTLGAWWAGKVLSANPKLAETAQSEDELRQAVSLPGCPWKYLRFIRQDPEAPPVDQGAHAVDQGAHAVDRGAHAVDRGAHAPSRAAAGAPPAALGATYSRRNLPHFERPWAKYMVTFSTCERRPLAPSERTLVLESIRYARDHGQIHLYAACVMPDHVHLLFEPQIRTAAADGSPIFHSLTEILQPLKSATAHRINKLRAASGPVWEKESFDRMIRSDADLTEKYCYIVNNPTEAGLTGGEEPYPWLVLSHTESPAGARETAREGACGPQETARGSACGPQETARGSACGPQEMASGGGGGPQACGPCKWTPAAGTFEGWPKTAAALKCLDPAWAAGISWWRCSSGSSRCGWRRMGARAPRLR